MKDLTKGKPIRLILLFAVPLFVGQLFQLFYSLADTRIVGQTLGDEALAAVGATTTLSDMLLSFLNGLTNGFAIVIATCFGAKDERQMKKAMGGTILLGSCCAVVLSGLCLLNMSGLLKLLNISPELFAAARGYIGIVIAGLLAATLYNICAAMLRAIGDSFTPLLFLILAAFLNIAMDYGFILCLHTGVEGAAYATVIAQAVSAFALRRPVSAAETPPKMVVTRDPNCGCCRGWVTHMRKAGFPVEMVEVADVTPLKTRLGVPDSLMSCHTAEIGGYVVEGHVPAAAIRRLLKERPSGVAGLSVPAMPVGVPGMEVPGAEPSTYEVVAFGRDGSWRPWMRFCGLEAV